MAYTSIKRRIKKIQSGGDERYLRILELIDQGAYYDELTPEEQALYKEYKESLGGGDSDYAAAYLSEAFAKAAKQFSEDPSTAEKGGVLGTVDVNTSTLDKAFLDAALQLKEGETTDWVYSSNFGYFRIHCNAASEDSLTAAYREQNSIPEGVEVTKEEVFNSLLSSYDTTLAGKALWEKGQELGMTFTDPGLETKLKQYMEAE